jgi:hypothetical protein
MCEYGGEGDLDPADATARLKELDVTNQALQLLAEHVFNLKQSLTPKRPAWQGRTDVRRMILGNIYQPCLTNPILLFNLLGNLGREQGLQTFAALTGLEMETENREKAFWDVAFFVLTNTLLIFQFQVENFLQNLWRELGGAEERSFIRLAEKVLSKIGLSETEEKMKRIRTLAYLRNSLHNNGVHRGPDFAVGFVSTLSNNSVSHTVRSNYSFVRNAKVTCCGPMHVYCLLAGVTDVVVEILGHQMVSQIPGPIADDFAWSDKAPTPSAPEGSIG